MSADNSIAPDRRDINQPTERSGFEIPPELAARYEVRIIDAPGSEQRIGLFRPGDRGTPAIEIADDRIVARSEDMGTIASLVEIARHNGWERIEVNGSPEFCRALWTAATREGLTVDGYAPSFDEAARMATLRRENATPRASQISDHDLRSRENGVTSETVRTNDDGPRDAALPASGPSARFRVDRWQIGEKSWGLLGETNSAEQAIGLFKGSVDTRVIDTRTGKALGTTDWGGDGSYPLWTVTPELDRLASQERDEKIAGAAEPSRPDVPSAPERGAGPAPSETHGRDHPPAPLAARASAAEERAIVERAFDRMTSELEANGDPRARSVRETASALVEQIYAEREERTAVRPTHETGPGPASSTLADRDRDTIHQGSGDDRRRRESEELADLFLHGTAEKIAAEPRLANALRAQTAMEQHIDAVFAGDASGMTSANFESRQMISTVLRRGLDVSVREPTPERQIEPVQTRPDLER